MLISPLVLLEVSPGKNRKVRTKGTESVKKGTQMQIDVRMKKEPGSSCIAAATAAKSLQSCLTLCDPIDGSPPGSPVPGILQSIIFLITISNGIKAIKKNCHSTQFDN